MNHTLAEVAVGPRHVRVEAAEPRAGTSARQRRALRKHNRKTGANKALADRFAGLTTKPSVHRRTTQD